MTRATWASIMDPLGKGALWRIFFLLIILLGIGIGWRHYLMAERALFVVPEKGRVLAILALATGPWLVLPAILVGVFSRRIGGYLLLTGGIISLAAIATVTWDIGAVIGWLWHVSGVMLLLGVGLIWCARQGPLFPRKVSE